MQPRTIMIYPEIIRSDSFALVKIADFVAWLAKMKNTTQLPIIPQACIPRVRKYHIKLSLLSFPIS
ncbi:hypothetical protein [Proteiniphilum sp.]|uniref:hypothetical protein n=1 Tax=Proteiniphilum sp. TaxID=1926877 RepID=UPI003320D22A